MKRLVHAYPGSGINCHTIAVESYIPFVAGGSERKGRVVATMISNGRQRGINLIERYRFIPAQEQDRLMQTNDPELWEQRFRSHAEAYIAHWKAFKHVGLPVVNTARLTNEGTLLLTDVKADGSETYGKGLRRVLEGTLKEIDQEPRINASIDSVFLGIMGQQWELVIKKVDELVTLATKNGIILPKDFDAFELLVHPDGSWQLITLDLRAVEITDINDLAERERVRRFNLEEQQAFIRDLIYLRDHLK